MSAAHFVPLLRNLLVLCKALAQFMCKKAAMTFCVRRTPLQVSYGTDTKQADGALQIVSAGGTQAVRIACILPALVP